MAKIFKFRGLHGFYLVGFDDLGMSESRQIPPDIYHMWQNSEF